MKRTFLAATGLVSGALLAGMLPDGDFERTAKGEKTGWRTTSAAGRVLAPDRGVGEIGRASCRERV